MKWRKINHNLTEMKEMKEMKEKLNKIYINDRHNQFYLDKKKWEELIREKFKFNSSNNNYFFNNLFIFNTINYLINFFLI